MNYQQRAAIAAIRHLSDAINGLTEVQYSTRSMHKFGIIKAQKHINLAKDKLAGLISEMEMANDQD